MNRVFADTSYYIALCNPDDAWNVAAVEAGSKCRAHIFTTEYVIVELGNCPVRQKLVMLRNFLRLQNTIANTRSHLLRTVSFDLYASKSQRAIS